MRRKTHSESKKIIDISLSSNSIASPLNRINSENRIVIRKVRNSLSPMNVSSNKKLSSGGSFKSQFAASAMSKGLSAMQIPLEEESSDGNMDVFLNQDEILKNPFDENDEFVELREKKEDNPH